MAADGNWQARLDEAEQRVAAITRQAQEAEAAREESRREATEAAQRMVELSSTAAR